MDSFPELQFPVDSHRDKCWNCEQPFTLCIERTYRSIFGKTILDEIKGYEQKKKETETRLYEELTDAQARVGMIEQIELYRALIEKLERMGYDSDYQEVA